MSVTIADEATRPRVSAAAVWGLGASQIIGYGTLYYSFSILAPAMAADLGWSAAWVYGAFSMALLAGGLISPWVGRAVDRVGAGRVMAAGSVAAALSLGACALAPERITFTIALMATELAATCVLYEAAFAVLVQIAGPRARTSITHLTLIAGFASTLFWPATSALHEMLSWRQIYLVFAALHLCVCLPIHLWLAQSARSDGQAHQPPAEGEAHIERDGSLPKEARRRAFHLLVLGFALGGFVLSALLVHMVPLLAAVGLGGMSALIGSVFGPAQVLSRVINMSFGLRIQPVTLAILSSALLPVSVVVLMFGAPWLVAALFFALALGLGSGLVSIVRGTVPLALFGPYGYGERLGKITAARLVLSSLAPFVFALVMERFGVAVALALLAALGLAGVLALLEIARIQVRSESVPVLR